MTRFESGIVAAKACWRCKKELPVSAAAAEALVHPTPVIPPTPPAPAAATPANTANEPVTARPQATFPGQAPAPHGPAVAHPTFSPELEPGPAQDGFWSLVNDLRRRFR